MSNWDELIAESRRLEQIADRIQDGENVGLSEAEIDKLTSDYYVWYGKCLSGLPEDLRSKFRSEFDGTFFKPKIKKFLEASTEPDRWRPSDKQAKEIWSYWAYPYEKTFLPYLRSQRSILLKASMRLQNSQTIYEVDKGQDVPNKEAAPSQSMAHQFSKNRWSLAVSILLVLIGLLWIIVYLSNASSVIYNAFYAFFAVFGVILAWLQWTSASPASTKTSNDTKNIKELFLKLLWRNRKGRAGLIIVMLFLILIVVGASSIARCTNVSNSTPQKTLALFCSALKQSDYQKAYDLLSSSVTQKISENAWVDNMGAWRIGLVSDCIVSNTSDDGSLGTGTITYHTPDGLDEIATYRLRNECGGWKIYDVYYS